MVPGFLGAWRKVPTALSKEDQPSALGKVAAQCDTWHHASQEHPTQTAVRSPVPMKAALVSESGGLITHPFLRCYQATATGQGPSQHRDLETYTPHSCGPWSRGNYFNRHLLSASHVPGAVPGASFVLTHLPHKQPKEQSVTISIPHMRKAPPRLLGGLGFTPWLLCSPHGSSLTEQRSAGRGGHSHSPPVLAAGQRGPS